MPRLAHRGPGLYLRSRALPASAAALIGTAAVTYWSARRLLDLPSLGANALVPVVVLAPLLAAGAIGTGLHTYSDDLDRTAVRAWWPRRLAHLLALTACAAALLALALPGHSPDFGWSAAVRNVLGATGICAAGAALLGARLSWLPATVYLSAVYLAGAPGEPGGTRVVWAWPLQPGPVPGAWTTAAVLFVLGSALYAWLGSRPERERPV
ncbi:MULTISPECIES: hypothetical protein [unclassified Streptomyces]|uniref:hypothetical protein n=1 Tax=unclassified Streptomyces TaxID=2593676 RepID=UPI0037F433C8